LQKRAAPLAGFDRGDEAISVGQQSVVKVDRERK